jgi:hypothetical protein
MATTFLTSKERQKYDAVPRKAYRFGFAFQTSCLRRLGRFPDNVRNVDK